MRDGNVCWYKKLTIFYAADDVCLSELLVIKAENHPVFKPGMIGHLHEYK